MESCFDEEERRAGRRAEDTRAGARENVDGNALVGFHSGVFGVREGAREDDGVEVGADGVVEAEATAIEHYLVNVLYDHI